MNTIHSLRVATLLALAATSASAAVSVVNGTLTVSDAVGGLNSKIIVGPDPGMVSLYQVPGAADGETYMGIRALRVLAGAGPDQIDLEIEQASSFDVLVDTGAGDSAIQVKWIVPPTTARVVPRLDLRPGAGAKRVFLDFDLVSAARSVVVDHAIRGGAGADEVKLGMTQIVRAPVRSTLQVGLGQSHDKLEILYGGVASSLTVSGGVTLDGGNDQMVFISDYATAAALNLHGNDGFDLIKAEIKGPLSGWRSGVLQLLGGIGNDELILGVQRGGIESIIDGGPGFDIGFGPGRIVNCEVIN